MMTNIHGKWMRMTAIRLMQNGIIAVGARAEQWSRENVPSEMPISKYPWIAAVTDHDHHQYHNRSIYKLTWISTSAKICMRRITATTQQELYRPIIPTWASHLDF